MKTYKMVKDLQVGDVIVKSDTNAKVKIKAISNGMMHNSKFIEWSRGEWANAHNLIPIEVHVLEAVK
jgi:hypothetical protein